jgi:hypothetical protein
VTTTTSCGSRMAALLSARPAPKPQGTSTQETQQMNPQEKKNTVVVLESDRRAPLRHRYLTGDPLDCAARRLDPEDHRHCG